MATIDLTKLHQLNATELINIIKLAAEELARRGIPEGASEVEVRIPGRQQKDPHYFALIRAIREETPLGILRAKAAVEGGHLLRLTPEEARGLQARIQSICS